MFLISDIDYQIKFKFTNQSGLKVSNHSFNPNENYFFQNLNISNFYFHPLTQNTFLIGFEKTLFKKVTISLSNQFIIEEFPFKNELMTSVFNDISRDSYKYAIAFSNNTINIYSAKDNQLWYKLLGGSMTIIPKSFVAHPTIQGFSRILITKYSIIGTLGNMIRIYNFKNN